ncbi:MAG: baseplate J/gp47 family protein [Anaerovoracaceae bacterium]
MILDASSLDTMIRGHITNSVRITAPQIDTSPNSVFDDNFIKPTAEIFKPVIQKLDKLEMMRNLDNAEFMTEEELNEVGKGNYFTDRMEGHAATTMLTLGFSNINIDDPNFELNVPAGIVFQSSGGMQFQTKMETVFTADDLRRGYDKVRMIYEAEILVEAIDIGIEYNVNSGEIKECMTPFSSYLTDITNKADVVDGSDIESNPDYADRIRMFATSRHLGTDPGYKAFIRETFSEVEDIYIAGADDPYMQRDLIDVYDKATQTHYPKHIGGMVDIYIKGFNVKADIASVVSNSSTIIIPVPFDSLSKQGVDILKNFTIYNLTDQSKTPKVASAVKILPSEYAGEYTDQTKIILDNTLNVSYDPTAISNMKIVYTHTVNTAIVTSEIYCDVGLTQTDLGSPLKSIISVKADGLSDEYSSKITTEIIKTGVVGTTHESSKMKLGVADIPNGRNITITYSVNETLRQMAEVFDYEEDRVLTADILAREAIAVPVNVQFRVSTESGKLDDSTKAKIQASVISFFDAYNLGDQIEQSDIVAWLYNDDNLRGQIKYIALPFDVFYIPTDPTATIPFDRPDIIRPADGVLPIRAIEYPLLNASKFMVTIA